eukprot:2190349-Pleurochrysis_carterae.AAC.1
MPTSPTTLAHPHTRSAVAPTPSPATQGRSWAPTPLARPWPLPYSLRRTTSLPHLESLLSVPHARPPAPSTSSTSRHDDASASAPQPYLKATGLPAPPLVGSRRRRSPSPASRTDISLAPLDPGWLPKPSLKTNATCQKPRQLLACSQTLTY